jgi:pyruvate dehydrogenase E1 component
LAITSADRLNAGWKSATSARAGGNLDVESHIEKLLSGVANSAAVITVHDAHPAALAWLGSVVGHRTLPLGVEHFGQAGTINDLYQHFEIDVQAILAAANSIPRARPVRFT